MNRHQKRAAVAIQKKQFRAMHKLVLQRLAKFEKALGSDEMQAHAFTELRKKWPGVKDHEIAHRVGLMSDSSRTTLLAKIRESYAAAQGTVFVAKDVKLTIGGVTIDGADVTYAHSGEQVSLNRYTLKVQFVTDEPLTDEKIAEAQATIGSFGAGSGMPGGAVESVLVERTPEVAEEHATTP